MALEFDMKELTKKLSELEKKVSKEDSKVEIYVIPTNEELMIAKETQKLIS